MKKLYRTLQLLQSNDHFLSSDEKWDCVYITSKNMSISSSSYGGDKWEGTYRNNVSGTTLRDKDIRHIFPHFDPNPQLLHQKQFTSSPTSSFPTVKIIIIKKKTWKILSSFLKRNFYGLNEAPYNSRQSTLQVAVKNKGNLEKKKDNSNLEEKQKHRSTQKHTLNYHKHLSIE